MIIYKNTYVIQMKEIERYGQYMKTRFHLRKLMKTSTFRLILMVIVVIIPINILTLMLSSTVVNEVENQVSRETQSALELYMSQVDDAIGRISTKVHYMSRDNVNFGRLNSKEIEDSTEYYKQLQALVLLQKDFDDTLTDNIWVTGIYSFFPQKQMNIMQSNSPPYRTDLAAYIQSRIDEEEVPNHGSWEIAQFDDDYVLISISNYKNAYYGAWIDVNELASKLKLKNDTEGNIKAITDSSGKVIFSGNTGIEQLDLTDSVREYEGTSYVLTSAASKYADFYLVQIIPKSQITKALPSMIRILQVASVMALFILPVIMFFMQKWMIHPINNLTRAMEKVEMGDMDCRIEEGNSGSEFEQINRNFNHMMDEVSNLKIDVYEEKLGKQQIKMRFLSQQIQPHFILNAMNILYSYEQDEFSLIQKMILCLSKYFRYIVNANTDFVELSQEMDHIRNYFEIQQARYPDTFFAMVEYEEEVADCLVPPLLVQNFAENAIKHSLKIGNKIDIIVVAQKTEDNHIRIRLSDTGEGMSGDLMRKVEVFRQTRECQEGLGVGIQNAIERLDILYEGKSKFKITREKPHGSRVEIVVPIYHSNGEERKKLEEI